MANEPSLRRRWSHPAREDARLTKAKRDAVHGVVFQVKPVALRLAPHPSLRGPVSLELFQILTAVLAGSSLMQLCPGSSTLL